ncbi:MAG: hypothetical protein EAZ06_00035 [Cytophagales bacterium]|nr:MAG: hypothetical protein EAZ06_00035 [Cytophagales bacterium]
MDKELKKQKKMIKKIKESIPTLFGIGLVVFLIYLIDDWMQTIDYGRKVFVIGQRIKGSSAKSMYTLYFYKEKMYVSNSNYSPNDPEVGTKYYISFIEKKGPEHVDRVHSYYTLPDFMSAYDIAESPVWYYPELKKIDTAFVPIRPHLYY